MATLGLAALCGAGCGDGGSLAPTAAGDMSDSPPGFGFSSGTTLTFVSGETGGRVIDAHVVLAGRDYDADVAGTLALTSYLQICIFAWVTCNLFSSLGIFEQKKEEANSDLHKCF